MKKWMLYLLTICLILSGGLLNARALSDADDLLTGQWAKSLAAIQDTLYALMDGENGFVVLSINPGKEAETLVTLPPEESVTHLLAQGEALYGFDMATGRLGSITRDGITWRDTAIDTQPMSQPPYMPLHPSLMGDSLMTPLMDGGSALDFAPLALAKSDLKTGETSLIDMPDALAFAPYKPGQLLLAKVEERPDGRAFWQLAAYELETGKETPLPMKMPEAFPYSGGIGALAYDAQNDRILYAQDKQVKASTALAPFERVALLNLDHMDTNFAQGFILDGGYAVYSGSLATRQTDRVIDARELTIRGHVSSDALQRFQQAHPLVLPTLQQGESPKPEDVFLWVQSGDDTVDVYSISVSPDFTALLNKGYAMDLSQDAELAQDAAALYPKLYAAMTDAQGRLRAVPNSVNSLETSVRVKHWREVFFDKPLPMTWGELMDARLAFANSERDDLIFFTFGDSPQVLNHLLRQYILHYEQPGQALDFDHPALRHALSAYLSAKDLRPDVEVEDPTSETGPTNHLVALFSSGRQFTLEYDPESVRDVPPFVFEDGQTPLSNVTVYAAIINPNSKHPELAMELLKTLSTKEADPRRYYAIHPDENAPYAYTDEEYEGRITFMKSQLKDFTEQIKVLEEEKEASGNLAFLRERVSQLNLDLANQEKLKWMISEEEIADYRQRARYMTTTAHSLLLGSQAWQQIEGLIDRLYQGALQVDGFIEEMNQLSRLVYQEGE